MTSTAAQKTSAVKQNYWFPSDRAPAPQASVVPLGTRPAVLPLQFQQQQQQQQKPVQPQALKRAVS